MSELNCQVNADETHGHGYSQVYERFITIFKFLAESKDEVTCVDVPRCWVPLILYLGHTVENTLPVVGPGWEGERLDWGAAYTNADDKRHVLEMSTAARPELVHALFCVDNEWHLNRRNDDRHRRSELFPVTTNGSFFRPEVLNYLARLRAWKGHDVGSKLVITPCFADKPYPSGVQQQIKLMLPDDTWKMASATGVLGICPDALWEGAPLYDSGVPNLERCEKIMRWFFTKFRDRYERVVVYSDFYAPAIDAALSRGMVNIDYVFGVHYRTGYETLNYELNLFRLQEFLVD